METPGPLEGQAPHPARPRHGDPTPSPLPHRADAAGTNRPRGMTPDHTKGKPAPVDADTSDTQHTAGSPSPGNSRPKHRRSTTGKTRSSPAPCHRPERHKPAQHRHRRGCGGRTSHMRHNRARTRRPSWLDYPSPGRPEPNTPFAFGHSFVSRAIEFCPKHTPADFGQGGGNLIHIAHGLATAAAVCYSLRPTCAQKIMAPDRRQSKPDRCIFSRSPRRNRARSGASACLEST